MIKGDLLFEDTEQAKKNKEIVLIDTLPKNARNQGSINLGLQIVAETLNCDITKWHDKLPKKYKQYAFNIIYPTHVFNMISFMLRNGIEPLKSKRKGIKIIAGGQGISNLKCLDDIVDEIYLGEFDNGVVADKNGWTRLTKLESKEVIDGSKAVIEITRGCKYRCKFCEYGWVMGGKYREKPWELVKEQIDACVVKGIRTINFLSANFGTYSAIDTLFEYCAKQGVQILNRDICLMDAGKIMKWIKPHGLNYLKIGVESFDEETRRKAGKNITDIEMEEILRQILAITPAIHIYLIYGLPDDNYKNWFKWIKKLGDIRKEYTQETEHLFGTDTENTKNIRIEMNITNFEPCKGTPYENEACVDFDHKNKFLGKWTQALKDNGFYKVDADADYKNIKGRWGRKEKSYQLLMALKTRGTEITDAIINAYPKGIGRTIKDKEADKFLNLIKKLLTKQ